MKHVGFRDEVLHRVFVLKEAITTFFFSDIKKNDDAYLFSNEDFIHKLACLTDILSMEFE
jgi:hypothetical protein